MLTVGFLADHAEEGVYQVPQIVDLPLEVLYSAFQIVVLLSLLHRASHLEANLQLPFIGNEAYTLSMHVGEGGALGGRSHRRESNSRPSHYQ